LLAGENGWMIEAMRARGHNLCNRQAAWPIAIAALVIVAGFLIALAVAPCARAQPSMGAPDPPNTAGPGGTGPKVDFIPQLSPDQQPAPGQPDAAGDVLWGAIGYTADGSWSSVWKMASKDEAEAAVAKKCAAFGRGSCEVVSFSGGRCVALATFNGRRWQLSFTSGADTYPEAQRNALARCNADERTRGNCQFRTAACSDGR
jgi:hypothetical protein